MHRFSVLFLAFVPLILLSCAKEPLKQAGLQGESTLGAVRELASAYERRDLEAFMDRVASGFPQRDALRGTVENVFAAYQNIRFTVQYRKMLVAVQHKGNISATFTWAAEWSTGSGKVVNDGGRVTFVMDPGTYKLLDIEGKTPFLPAAAPVPAKE